MTLFKLDYKQLTQKIRRLTSELDILLDDNQGVINSLDRTDYDTVESQILELLNTLVETEIIRHQVFEKITRHRYKSRKRAREESERPFVKVKKQRIMDSSQNYIELGNLPSTSWCYRESEGDSKIIRMVRCPTCDTDRLLRCKCMQGDMTCLKCDICFVFCNTHNQLITKKPDGRHIQMC